MPAAAHRPRQQPRQVRIAARRASPCSCAGRAPRPVARRSPGRRARSPSGGCCRRSPPRRRRSSTTGTGSANVARAQHAADEPHDPGVAREARLVAVEAGHEEAAPTAGTGRRTCPASVRCAWSIARPPRLAPMPDRPAGDRDVLAQRRQDPVAQRAAVRRRGRVPLVAVAGRQQRDPKRRQPPGLDHRAGVAGQSPASSSYSGPSWATSSGSSPSHGDQTPTASVAAEHADRRPARASPRAARSLEPRRRAVAGRRQHRLLPERPGGALRVARVAHDHGVAVVVAQLELVLEAREAAVGKMQHPAAVLTGEIGSGSGRSERSRTPARRSSGSSTRRVPNTAPKVADSVPAMSYSVVHVDDLEGAGPGGAVRFVRRELGVEAFGIDWFELPPNAQGHEHNETRSDQEEVSVVIRGSGHWVIDGDEVPARVGTFLRFDPGATRCSIAAPTA